MWSIRRRLFATRTIRNDTICRGNMYVRYAAYNASTKVDDVILLEKADVEAWIKNRSKR